MSENLPVFTFRLRCEILGILHNNVYFLEGPKGLVIIDPAAKPELIIGETRGLTVTDILITHGHFDHIGAAARVREITGAPVLSSKEDAAWISGIDWPTDARVRKTEPCPVDRLIADGDVIDLAGLPAHVLATPGHSKGSLCFLIYPDEAREAAAQVGYRLEGIDAPMLFSGDTLFQGCYGRTDFEGGDEEAMAASLQKLYKLPDETMVFPGHGSPTTIGRERPWLSTAFRSL